MAERDVCDIRLFLRPKSDLELDTMHLISTGCWKLRAAQSLNCTGTTPCMIRLAVSIASTEYLACASPPADRAMESARLLSFFVIYPRNDTSR